MNRSFVSALLSLACLSALPALAQSTGSAQPSVSLSIGANPVPGNVPVTAIVQPYIGSTKIPTGTVTFLDGTTVLNQGGTTLTPPGGVTSQTFAAAIGALDPGLAAVAQGMITGDFDGDGKPDLLVYGSANASTSTEVQVFLTSNAGSSHFRAVAPQTLAIPLPNYVTPTTLYADTDTKLDLLIGNMVAYGNGDGTFSNPAVLPSVAQGFRQTYIAEGITGSGPALIAVNAPPNPIPSSGTVQYTFTVFSISPNGTFTSLGRFALAAPIQLGGSCCSLLNVFGLSFSDVNGDGNIDVISQSNSIPVGNAEGAVNYNVMLNNGNGTFGAPKPLDTSVFKNLTPSAIAFGDLNDDGKADLVTTYAENTGNNYIAAALGNGDGTFGTFSTLDLFSSLTPPIPNPQVQLTDVNGDGKLDAVTGSGQVTLGNGDGSFTLGTPFFAQTAQPKTLLNYPLIQIPINANAAQSLVYLNPTSGVNAVFTPQNAATVQGTLALAVGTHTVEAQYSGDSTYAAATATVNVSVASVPPTMTFATSAATIYATNSVTFTATLSDPTATGIVTLLDTYIGSDPLQPNLNPSATTLGTATVTNGVATFTTNQLPAGVHTITAAYGADVYNPIATAQLTETVNMPFTVSRSGIEITLTASPGGTASTQLTIAGLGGFTGPVTFGCSDFEGICSFSPATVNVAGASTTTVTLTVTATKAPTIARVSSFSNTLLACGVPLLALFGIASAGRRRALFAVIAIVLCGISCLGCGGSGSGGGGQQGSNDSLVSGDHPFYVTATSGQNEIAINADLTVQ